MIRGAAARRARRALVAARRAAVTVPDMPGAACGDRAPGTRGRTNVSPAPDRRNGGGPSHVQPIDVLMMRRALRLAQRAAAEGEVPVGAIVYRGREVLGEGFNVREANDDPVGHAEIIALRRAAERLGRWRLSECSMAVTLEPCAMCAGALVNARLDRLVYGALDPKAGACHSLYAIPTDVRLNHRLHVIGGVLARPCGAVLTRFFRARRAGRGAAASRRQ